jgi:hypothetical protein
MKYIPMPTAEYLKVILDYNEGTGGLTWKTRPREHFNTGPLHLRWNTRFAGKSAGSLPSTDGYCRISIDGTTFVAHRIIWKMQTAHEPTEIIDHWDLNRGNNAWSNLRQATHSKNHHNMKAPANNTSGQKGVHWDKSRNRWLAYLMLKGKRHQIGRFRTKDEAARAHREAAHKLHGEFARTE